MRWRVPSAECGLAKEAGRAEATDELRVDVPVTDEVEGGGVVLFRRPPVSERKALKSAWVEARRSGVNGTCPDGGDMRLGVVGRVLGCSNVGRRRCYSARGRAGAESWSSGAGA